MIQYQTKSQTCQSVQWTGVNKEEIKAFINGESNFLFENNGVLTVYSSQCSMSLLITDYLIRLEDGTFMELDEVEFACFFEKI